MKKLTLPNGKELFYIDKLTAFWVYNEIFEENMYLKHGIGIKKGDIVFDVGANIGLFSLFIAEKASDLKIYTFEPIKPIFEVLEANLIDIPCSIENYNIGLSNENNPIEINFYPKVSADSAIIPFDMDYKIEKYVENYEEVVCEDMPIARIVPKFLRKRVVRSYISKLYQEEKLDCQLSTLSDIIEENNIERIDLLKIDAENYEKQVIGGIRESDWEKIKQITMEVHEHIQNGLGLLNVLTELLKSKGFETFVGEEDRSTKLGVYMLYAKKNDLMEL